MDLRLVREHLAEVEWPRRPERQIIDELERGGYPTLQARDLLHTQRMVHATHLAHRDFIRKELEH